MAKTTRSRRTHHALQDEQGDWSFARGALTLIVPFTMALILADAASTRVNVPDLAYHLLEVTIGGLMAWAGGPRVVRYFKREKAESETPTEETAP